MSAPALLLLMTGSALAQKPTPLVYDKGSPQSAVSRVNDELGDRAAEFTLVPERASDLLSGPPQLIGGGEAERCKSSSAEGVAATTFTSRVLDVENLVRAGDFERALLSARAAELMLPCLNEVIARETVRDLYAYWAASAARQSTSVASVSPDRAGTYRGEALRAYESWRRFIPDERELTRRADAIGTPDGRALAQSVVNSRQPSTSFQVLPDVAALWIDGGPVSPSAVQRLLLGRHLVQFRSSPEAGVQSLWVHLNAKGSSTLAVPEIIPPDLSSWVEDRERQEDLAAILGVLGPGEDLFLVTPSGRVWRGVAGDPDGWESLSGGGGGAGGWARAGRITTVAGLSLFGAGVATMGISCLASRSNQPETSAWYDCGEPVGGAFQTFRAGQGALLTGLGVAGAGLTIDLIAGRQMNAHVQLSIGGTGVRVSVGDPGPAGRNAAYTLPTYATPEQDHRSMR